MRHKVIVWVQLKKWHWTIEWSTASAIHLFVGFGNKGIRCRMVVHQSPPSVCKVFRKRDIWKVSWYTWMTRNLCSSPFGFVFHKNENCTCRECRCFSFKYLIKEAERERWSFVSYCRRRRLLPKTTTTTTRRRRWWLKRRRKEKKTLAGYNNTEDMFVHIDFCFWWCTTTFEIIILQVMIIQLSFDGRRPREVHVHSCMANRDSCSKTGRQAGSTVGCPYKYLWLNFIWNGRGWYFWYCVILSLHCLLACLLNGLWWPRARSFLSLRDQKTTHQLATLPSTAIHLFTFFFFFSSPPPDLHSQPYWML